jgi:hypothetical protein
MRRLLGLSLALGAATLSAQSNDRRATNLATLLAHPGYYHMRPIAIVGTTVMADTGELLISDDAGSLRILYKDGRPEGWNEIRGEFWDLGRMNTDDPRLASYDLKTAFQIDPEGPWPRPGTVMALIATSIQTAVTPPQANIRSLVLQPSRYFDLKVTIVGQFGGRNLLGDLPDAPARSRYDFVLRTADAAIWVANIQPRGRDFDLALDARIDTGRWLEVSGRIQQARGLQWLDAEPGSLKLIKPPIETTSAEPQIRVPAAPPPEVVFSAPTQDEIEVMMSASVRIQFSRDIDPATFKGRTRVRYVEADGATSTSTSTSTETDPPGVVFTTEYRAATRVLEIKFTKPLDRFRTVQVELLPGILGTDQQPLVPWTLTFMTGAS